MALVAYLMWPAFWDRLLPGYALTVTRSGIAVVILIGCGYALAALVLESGSASLDVVMHFTKMVLGTYAIGVVCAILGARVSNRGRTDRVGPRRIVIADNCNYPQMAWNLRSTARAALRTFLPSIRRAWLPRSRIAPSPRRTCSSPLASRCKGAEESDGPPGVLAFRVVHDLPDLLGTPAGDGELASPRQRLLA